MDLPALCGADYSSSRDQRLRKTGSTAIHATDAIPAPMIIDEMSMAATVAIGSRRRPNAQGPLGGTTPRSMLVMTTNSESTRR